MDIPKASQRPRISRALIWDIAREAGVSIATVSRALNGKADVSQATREKILQIVREKGYVSNQHARSLVKKLSGYIGFAVPNVGMPYPAQIAQGAAEALDEYEAHLVLCLTAFQREREKSLLHQLVRGGVDGALIVNPVESSAELGLLQQRGFPLVVIDPILPVADDFCVVASANMAGACQAVEHLVALGHRRIGIITGPVSWHATTDRLAGYHAVLSRAGLPIDPLLEVEANHLEDKGISAARRLFDLAEPPTAIFAYNDGIAVQVLRAAEERGLRVPRDLSIVGFDDAAIASLITPALTTVNQPTQEMGRTGATLLFQMLQGEAIESPRVVLPTRLVVRASTGPCPTPQ